MLRVKYPIIKDKQEFGLTGWEKPLNAAASFNRTVIFRGQFIGYLGTPGPTNLILDCLIERGNPADTDQLTNDSRVTVSEFGQNVFL